MTLHLKRVSISVAVLTAGTLILAGAASIPAQAAPSTAAQRRAAMLSAGVDPTPTGTAGQVERAKAARAAKD